MDKTDRAILKLLSAHAECTAVRLAQEVHMSVPAVNKRVARLREAGVIQSYTVRLNAKAIEKSVVGSALLVLEQYAMLDELLRFVDAEPDILEFHAITGEYDYIAKICAHNIEDFESKLLRLKKQKGVAKSNTFFSLLEYKNLPGPLPD